MRLVTLLACNIIISEFVPSPCSLFSGRQSHMNMASATLSFAAWLLLPVVTCFMHVRSFECRYVAPQQI